MPNPIRRVVAALGAATVLLALLVAGATSASARTPHPPRTFSATIEDMTAYVGQTSCDPTVKHGTQELGDLLARTYGGTSWQSTYACGTDGSQSEHYEGRAIDWMVSARDKTTLAQARAFYRWLLAPDAYGNRYAMARRVGVMYIIFNNQMWGSWDGKWEPYNNCLTKRMAPRANDNACHRTHMHISLSWNGARGKTTFWTGRVYRTDYGPCIRKGHKYAPKWTKPNYTGC
jgi:hypothetical protein